MKKINLIVLGTGGSSRDIVDIIKDINQIEQQVNVIGFLDDNSKIIGQTIMGLEVLGNLKDCHKFNNSLFINGIGSPSNFFLKKDILRSLGISQNRYITIIHPSASIANSAKIGQGVVIYPHVTISSNAKISDQVIVLSNSVISHDVKLGKFSCIAGGVCIASEVRVGESCYIGQNSSLIGGVTIGNQSLIGMGSVVLNNIEKNSVIVGNPSKFLRSVK